MNIYNIRTSKIWMCMVFMLRKYMNGEGMFFKLQRHHRTQWGDSHFRRNVLHYDKQCHISLPLCSFVSYWILTVIFWYIAYQYMYITRLSAFGYRHILFSMSSLHTRLPQITCSNCDKHSRKTKNEIIYAQNRNNYTKGNIYD